MTIQVTSATLLVVFRNIVLLFICLTTAAAAPPKSPNALTFALSQMRANAGIINFDNNCPGNPTPGLAAAQADSPDQLFSAAWHAPCRTLNGGDLLTILRKANSDDGVTLEGANLVRTPGYKRIYLYARTFPTTLNISYSRITDTLDLDNAHLNALDIDNTMFANGVSAKNMVLDDNLKLDNDRFSGLANLQEIHVKYYAVLNALSGDNNLLLKGSSVDGYLFLQKKLQFDSIDLSDSKIGKELQFIGAFGSGSFICQRCAADSLNITSNPKLPFKGDVDFSYSKFGSEISIQKSTFEGRVYFDNIDASDVNISNSSFAQGLWLEYANISGIVHFGTVTLQSLHLANAKIDRALDMASVDASSWQPAGGVLDISNTSTGAFTDCKAAWPARIDLDGFSYDAIGISANSTGPASGPPIPCQHIGGSGKTTSDQGWIDFLGSNYDPDDPNRVFNPQPYTYLANYFAKTGNNQYADDILYESRLRSMGSAWQTHDYVRWLGLGFLWLIAGFGIGGGAMLHLSLTIVGSIVLGLFVMKCSPRARNHHWFWCLGACVQRLLPIVKLLKEFDNYFDEPDVREDNPALGWRQKFFFSLYALWGWILGFLLVAILSGVTQAP